MGRNICILLVICIIIIGAFQAFSQEQTAPKTAAADYVGSQACLLCHRDLETAWTTTPHGRTLSSTSLPKEIQGCEACHGPGSTHVGSTGKIQIANPADLTVAQIEATCAQCHFSDRNSSIPSGWPTLDAKHSKRSAHANKSTSCLACHTIHAASAKTPSASANKSCLTCHSALINSKGYTHTPVAKGSCTLCHDPHGTTAAHDVKPAIGETCATCHDTRSAALTAAHKGYSVAGSNCVRCHDPHSFDKDRALLRKVAHPPFQKGNCTICHSKAPSPGLNKPSPDLCFGCHGKDKILPVKDSDYREMHLHAPAMAGLCTKCHEPHVSDTPSGLIDEPAVVCTTCHQGIGTAMSASHQHKPVADGNCITCHKPHASAEKRLLKKSQISLCQSCHKDQATHAHPVGEKTKDPNNGEPLLCASCHAIHGSEFKSILPKEQTAMCLGCHRLE